VTSAEPRKAKHSATPPAETGGADGVAESTTFTVVSSSRLGRVSQFLVLAGEWTNRGVTAARFAGRWLHDTVTRVGWLCLILLVLWLPLGIWLRWPEFAVTGVIALILVLAAIPFLFGGRSYAVNFQLPDDRVIAGSEVIASLSVTNTSARIELPGRMDIPIGAGFTDLSIPLMRPGQTFETEVVIPAYRRGVIDIGPITTVRTDLVGVLRRELEWADVRQLFVHPVTVSVPNTSAGLIRDLEGNPTVNLVDSDISFHAIREYAPGDGQRHIHWKSTAKTGKIMVRQFEESRRSRMVLILGMNRNEFAEDEEYETAVSVIGSLGMRAIRDGRDVAAISSAEIPTVARRSVRSIKALNVQSSRKLLDDLSLVNSSEQAMRLDDVCRLTTQMINDMSLAVIICGSKVTPKELQRMRLQLPNDVGVLAVICDPNATPSFRSLVGLNVLTVAIVDDIRGLMARFS
jgi:hypothetical protein